MMKDHGLTPAQTVGPFFAYGLTPAAYDYDPLVGNDLRTDDVVGEPIVVTGRLIDGGGDPVTDAMIEIWQADGEGRYAGVSEALANTRFKGFGRSETPDGMFRFLTVKPGRVPGPEDKDQAPHINVGIFARGMLKRLFTRIYFDDEGANEVDPVLGVVPPDRRATLIAHRDGAADGLPRYVIDIHLQGDEETVFFEA
jgi:protocatechuate 3,4-dioxygenase, alpha subunit